MNGRHRLAHLICANGLGHFVRAIQVIDRVVSTAPAVEVTIGCAAWQKSSLSHWAPLGRLMANDRVRFVDLETQPRWTGASATFDERLLRWHEVLAALDLDAFDLVISDNMPEVLGYCGAAVLMGSFLWHDVLSDAWPGDRLVAEYAARCRELLAQHRPVMVANEYFAMPAVRTETRMAGIGFLPPVVAPGQRRTDGLIGVLLAGGQESPVSRTLCRLAAVRDAKVVPSNVRLFLDSRMPVDAAGVSRFDYHKDDFSQIDVVIARPGLGTITDCVGTRRLLLAILESNGEMRHNASLVESLGLGWSVESADACIGRLWDLSARWMRGPVWPAGYDLNMKGLETAVELIVRQLQGSPERRAAWPA